ncbi:glycoside hydrolase family 16 protein [Puniceicoccus vermicola]|uniref:Family 16 glycosylhydrolase n=1 Tax=Puniceicoccus vermicola TaxID=388746 RepID=A0A7X1B3E9_9BACT|nr:glycoside hydrolase family 16 protein [Puniceicoccus vermicola]MBC2603690.1 family 16 glycosylhydrolase [Puniceicoccus vermicola]
MKLLIQTFLSVLAALSLITAQAETAKSLIEFNASDALTRIKPSSEQVTVAVQGDAIAVTIIPESKTYPGVAFLPAAGFWDLSAYGHIEAKIKNTGTERLRISMRVDNEGNWRDAPWNTETIGIPPGETGTVKVIFGLQSGFKPGYALNPAAIKQVLLFTTKSSAVQSFVVESIQAGGNTGEKAPLQPASLSKPKDVSTKPEAGFMLGGKTTFDPDRQLKSVTASMDWSNEPGQPLKLRLSDQHTIQVIELRAPTQKWDLSQHSEVTLKLSNPGSIPLRVCAQLRNGKTEYSDLIVSEGPLLPGERIQLTIPFASTIPWQGPDIVTGEHHKVKDGTGSALKSDRVESVRLTVFHNGDAELAIEEVRAQTPTPTLPEWIGERPPVDGDWVLTFDEEFDGDSIDLTKWRVHGPNYWGHKNLTHWSKDNMIVKDGVAIMRLEKKHGYHNDDPASGHESAYQGGYLDTYGIWAQRYGYFESRMKMPSEPGLWPAFWLMPDRGPETGEQWQRQDTRKHGMEFDIMEHLTRWGPNRFNIALHWDGYHDQHKAIGTSLIYVEPDEEGYITCGLLWTPGKAVFYYNGREVGRWENERVSNVRSVIMFTMPIGGWDNNDIDDSTLPADFLIDYVRVWQRADLASEMDGLFVSSKAQDNQ